MFKSCLERGEGHIYSNLKKTTPLNEGKYMIKYGSIKAHTPAADIKLRSKQEVNPRLFKVPLCVLNQTECTHQTRKMAKAGFHEQFNSVVLVGESFFSDRNLNKKFKPKRESLESYAVKKHNITQKTIEEKEVKET